MKSKNTLTVIIETYSDAVAQLEQLLNEEKKSGYIKKFSVRNNLTEWKEKFCHHTRISHVDGECLDCDLQVITPIK